MLYCGAGAQPADPRPGAVKPPSSRGILRNLHLEEAAKYRIYLDAGRKELLELRREPVYRWTNPTRSGGQEGDVLVWTYRGRPEAVGSIFSHPISGGRRRLCHEFHSLSLSTLVPLRNSPNQWRPRAGIKLEPIPAAPPPAESARQRLLQMKSLNRQFSANSMDERGERWELRLLPRPLYRYQSTSPEVIDGGLFTYVTSAGTDPEVMVMIEARKTGAGGRWLFAGVRFSDLNLYLRHNGKVVWSSIRGATNTFSHDAQHLFRFYLDKEIPEIVEKTP